MKFAAITTNTHLSMEVFEAIRVTGEPFKPLAFDTCPSTAGYTLTCFDGVQSNRSAGAGCSEGHTWTQEHFHRELMEFEAQTKLVRLGQQSWPRMSPLHLDNLKPQALSSGRRKPPSIQTYIVPSYSTGFNASMPFDAILSDACKSCTQYFSEDLYSMLEGPTPITVNDLERFLNSHHSDISQAAIADDIVLQHSIEEEHILTILQGTGLSEAPQQFPALSVSAASPLQTPSGRSSCAHSQDLQCTSGMIPNCEQASVQTSHETHQSCVESVGIAEANTCIPAQTTKHSEKRKARWRRVRAEKKAARQRREALVNQLRQENSELRQRQASLKEEIERAREQLNRQANRTRTT